MNIDIAEWFDPDDAAHLKAWRHLSLNGMWPEGFIPPNVTFNPVWQASLAFIMADKWVNKKLYENGN